MAEQKPNIPTKVHGGQKGAESKLTNIVRMAGRDLDGNKDIAAALRNIKGISHNLASAIALVTERKFGIKQTETIGYPQRGEARGARDRHKGAPEVWSSPFHA